MVTINAMTPISINSTTIPTTSWSHNGGVVTISGGAAGTTNNVQIYGGTGGGGYYGLPYGLPPAASFFYYDLKQIESALSDLRKKAEDFCKNSKYFGPSLVGYSGLAARQIFKELKRHVSDIKFAYVNEIGYLHAYCIITHSDKEYIADITASIYGENTICLLEKSLIDIKKQPWWAETQTYKTESAFLKRLRKDGWPEERINIDYKPQLQFIESGVSDIENRIIKILPFDEPALKYLKQLAKSDSLKTNVAQLILDCNDNDLKTFLKIIVNSI